MCCYFYLSVSSFFFFHRCVCINDSERWTPQQLLDHSFLKPPSPRNLPQYQDASPEGDSLQMLKSKKENQTSGFYLIWLRMNGMLFFNLQMFWFDVWYLLCCQRTFRFEVICTFTEMSIVFKKMTNFSRFCDKAAAYISRWQSFSVSVEIQKSMHIFPNIGALLIFSFTTTLLLAMTYMAIYYIYYI